MIEHQPIDLDDLRRVSGIVREHTDDNWLADMVEIAAAEIERLREERRWVPVGERLPEIEDRVDVSDQRRDFIAWRTPSDWRNEDEYGINVTHWRKRTPGPEGGA